MGRSIAILAAWLVSGVALLGVDLGGVDLSGADLSAVDLSGVHLGGVDFGRLAEIVAKGSGLSQGPWIEALLVLMAVLLRGFLHTGLFIVAHDAMHGVLRPGSPEANARWGRLALGLYAGLPYGSCRAKHQQHHRCPGGDHDPDFHGSAGARLGEPLRWYIRFLGSYLSWGQMLRLLGGWAVVGLLSLALTPTAVVNLLLFWILPLLLSSLQLFVFGTYLPHRATELSRESHRPRSLDLPVWLSLLTCYHFGYHWEHHQYPWLAWHELPRSRYPGWSDRVPPWWGSTWPNEA